MKNIQKDKTRLDIRLWPDAIPFTGIYTAIKRNENIETENLRMTDLERTCIYAFYQVGFTIPLTYYTLLGLDKILGN